MDILPLPKAHTFYVDIREQFKYCINAFYGTFKVNKINLDLKQFLMILQHTHCALCELKV